MHVDDTRKRLYSLIRERTHSKLMTTVIRLQMTYMTSDEMPVEVTYAQEITTPDDPNYRCNR